MIRAYCYLTDEQAHYLSLSNEDRRKVPNRKAILESLCLLPEKTTRTTPKPRGRQRNDLAGDIAPIVIDSILIALAAAFFVDPPEDSREIPRPLH